MTSFPHTDDRTVRAEPPPEELDHSGQEECLAGARGAVHHVAAGGETRDVLSDALHLLLLPTEPVGGLLQCPEVPLQLVLQQVQLAPHHLLRPAVDQSQHHLVELRHEL